MADALLGALLRQVSRSFYLSLAILPRPLREPIGLAYLLARAADTVADTRLIKCEGRLGHLETLRRACAGEAVDVGTLARACASQQAPAERVLLERVGEALDRVEALAPADRHEVRAVLATLTSGMIFNLTRFPGEDSKGLSAPATGPTPPAPLARSRSTAACSAWRSSTTTSRGTTRSRSHASSGGCAWRAPGRS